MLFLSNKRGSKWTKKDDLNFDLFWMNLNSQAGKAEMKMKNLKTCIYKLIFFTGNGCITRKLKNFDYCWIASYFKKRTGSWRILVRSYGLLFWTGAQGLRYEKNTEIYWIFVIFFNFAKNKTWYGNDIFKAEIVVFPGMVPGESEWDLLGMEIS